MEYGEEVRSSDFIPIAWWIANAWDPCEGIRHCALERLCIKHSENVRNLQLQGKSDQSAEIELWNPCVTISYPPAEGALVKQIEQDVSNRARRELNVRDANLFEWRIWKGFGEGPWTVSRKATPQNLATLSRWVQLDWPIHRSEGVLCPNGCLCATCLGNFGFTDKKVKRLRRIRNPTETEEKLDATMFAMIDIRRYCFDTYMGLQRRTNMDKNIRDNICKRVRAELDWVLEDRVKLFTTEREFKQHKDNLASFIDPIIHPSSHELKLDTLDAERRAKMQEYFLYKDIVKATDPSTGEGVIGTIDFTIRSERLGTGSGPDWVYVKDMWYRDNEVQLATTQETHDYHTAVVDFDNEAGNLVDGSISDVVDVGAKDDKPLSSEHTAGYVLYCQSCKRCS